MFSSYHEFNPSSIPTPEVWRFVNWFLENTNNWQDYININICIYTLWGVLALTQSLSMVFFYVGRAQPQATAILHVRTYFPSFPILTSECLFVLTPFFYINSVTEHPVVRSLTDTYRDDGSVLIQKQISGGSPEEGIVQWIWSSPSITLSPGEKSTKYEALEKIVSFKRVLEYSPICIYIPYQWV